jgi:uncharacterized protein YjlB
VSGPETLLLRPNGWVPNNLATSALLYRGVLPACDADAIEAVLRQYGWPLDWRDGVYPYHHYHSTAHEALVCGAGSARLMLGGEGGREVTVGAGDLLVLPAGAGHCRIAASDDFLLVGAYPHRQKRDICHSAADAATLARVAAVPRPRCDPVMGGGWSAHALVGAVGGDPTEQSVRRRGAGAVRHCRGTSHHERRTHSPAASHGGTKARPLGNASAAHRERSTNPSGTAHIRLSGA